MSICGEGWSRRKTEFVAHGSALTTMWTFLTTRRLWSCATEDLSHSLNEPPCLGPVSPPRSGDIDRCIPAPAPSTPSSLRRRNGSGHALCLVLAESRAASTPSRPISVGRRRWLPAMPRAPACTPRFTHIQVTVPARQAVRLLDLKKLPRDGLHDSDRGVRCLVKAGAAKKVRRAICLLRNHDGLSPF
jgi:hypothetical protein